MMPFSVVSTQALLISHTAHLAKLPFFQKTLAVVAIVNLTHIFVRNRRKGVYTQDTLNTPANAPSSKQYAKKGGVSSGAYGRYMYIGY